MKKLFSKIIVFVMTLALLLSFVACQESSSSSNSTEQSSISTEQSSSSNATQTSSSSVVFTPATLDVFVPSFTQPSVQITPATTPVKVFLVGDSTVCEYTETKEKSSYYYMRNGYGMRLGEYLNENVTIRNLAISGRSSKSFLVEANYQTLKNEIGAGDYLIIGFGHNDQKTEPPRYTNPNGSVTDETSFKYSLYENYIKIAEEAGATAILCTPIVRRVASGTYSGTSIHQTKDATANSVNYAGGDYTKAIVELGEEKNVTVIDLTTLTKEMLTGVSADKSASIYAWTRGSATTSIDNTHINAYGAQIVARLFTEELLKSDCSLKNYVLETLPVPNADVLVALEK